MKLFKARTQEVSRFFLILVLVLIAVRPHMQFLPDLMAVYLADIFIVLIFFIWLLCLEFRLLIVKYEIMFAISISALLLVFTFIIVVNIFLNGDSGFAASLNFARFFYYGFVMLFFIMLIRNSCLKLHFWMNFLDWAFAINFLIVLIQLLDPPMLGPFIREFFGSEKLRSLWTGYPRVYGAFFNANWFAVYLLFCATGWLAMTATGVLKFRGLLLRSLLLILVLLFSGSRTGVIGLTVGVLSVLIVGKKAKTIMGAFLIMVLSCGLFVFLQDNIQLASKTIMRFGEAFAFVVKGNVAEVDSLSSRISSWSIAFDAWLSNPLFGLGDNGLGRGFIPHNSLLTFLMTFGIVGFATAFMWLLWIFKVVMFSGACTEMVNTLKLWFIGFSISFLAMGMAGDFIFTTQVMLLWIILLSVVIVNTQGSKNNQYTC